MHGRHTWGQCHRGLRPVLDTEEHEHVSLTHAAAMQGMLHHPASFSASPCILPNSPGPYVYVLLPTQASCAAQQQSMRKAVMMKGRQVRALAGRALAGPCTHAPTPLGLQASA